MSEDQDPDETTRDVGRAWSTDPHEMAIRSLGRGIAALRKTVDELEQGEIEMARTERKLGDAQRDMNNAGDSALDRLMASLETLIAETQLMKLSAGTLRAGLSERAEYIDELKRSLERERRRAETDQLTGMPNRHWLERAMRRVMEDAETASLILLDIDRFKRINDRLGHDVGDKVIRAVAKLMTNVMRVKELATVARWGGEEFLVLLPGHDITQAATLAERIRRTVEQARIVRAGTKEPIATVTLSAGVSALRSDDDETSWLKRADAALYRAKRSGRNRVEIEKVR